MEVTQGNYMPSNPNFRGVGAYQGYSTSAPANPNKFQNFFNQFLDRTFFGSKEGRQAKYDESKKSIFGMPLPEFGLSEYLGMPDSSVARENQENEKIQKEKERRAALGLDNDDTSKVPSFEDIMGMDVGKYMDKVAQVGEKAKDRDALRAGISSLAYSPLIGSQAAMDAAANIGQLTGVNMAAIANQSSLMSQNPTKQKIAGKYFR